MKKLFTLVFVSMFMLGFAQDPGTLDSTFGTDGIFRFAPSNSHDFAESVLVQADGKILTVGRSRTDGTNYGIYVSRHNVDGSLDETYGDGGISHFKINPTIYINGAKDAVLSDDGLLFVTGWTYDYVNNTSFILCLDENGFEHPLFGNEGWVESQYGGGIVYESIDVDSHGRPVVTGYLNDTIIVRRYNAVGKEDLSFGNKGTVHIGLNDAIYSNGNAIKVVENDKILVAVTKYEVWNNDYVIQKAAVCKFKSNGSLDNTFGDNGILDLNVGEYAEFPLALDVDADGNYLVAGHSELPTQSETLPRYESFVTRVTKNGEIDRTFGTDGFTRFEPFEGDGCVNNSYAVTAAPDGQIFGALYSFNHNNQASRAYVYNLDANGQPKETFAGTGMLPLNLQGDDVEIRAYSTTLQDDGKLLVGGYVYVNDGYASDILIARVNTDIVPSQPQIDEAEVSVVAEAISFDKIKAIVTPNEFVTEYHVGIFSELEYEQAGLEDLMALLQSDNTPYTGVQEITFDGLTAETRYIVLVTAKDAQDNWISKESVAVTPKNEGFAELENAKFNIYPNPATSTIFVESTSDAQVSIIDLTGRCVKEVEITENISAINIEDINKGVYFIMVQSENNRIVEKLIVR